MTHQSVAAPAPTASGASIQVPRHPHVLAATCCVAFALSVDPLLWMMGVDIPTRAFGAGWQDYRIFTTATAVLLVACMLIGGLLGDYYGRRRVLLLASVLTAVGGLLTALAPEMGWVLVARSIGAAAGAIALPLTLAVIRLSFAGRERVRAMLIYNLAIGVGLLLSLLAVFIEEVAGWRATLILPTLATAVGSVLVWRFVPESRAATGLLEQATTAVVWSLTLLPLTLGALVAHVGGTWANPITGVSLVVSAFGVVALVFVWRGRLRTSLTRGLGHRDRHLLSVMLLTAATLSFGLMGYVLQVYGFFTARAVLRVGTGRHRTGAAADRGSVDCRMGDTQRRAFASSTAHRWRTGGDGCEYGRNQPGPYRYGLLVVRVTDGLLWLRVYGGADRVDSGVHECHA